MPDGPRIDRDSPVPFYFQLRGLLEGEIDAGRWRAGEQLPAEAELCTRYGISRSTVRQALHALEADGIVRRRRGRGTFVAEPRARTWLVQSSDGVFQQGLDRTGRQMSSQILRAVVEPMSSWASDALGVAPGEEGVTLERLRSVDGRPALYVVSHLPAFTMDTIVGADLERTSLYDLLQRRHGLEIRGARRTLEAVDAAERLASLLETEPGDPLAFIESVSWDQQERPFDVYRAWLRTDRLAVEIAVRADSGQAPKDLR